MNADFSYELKIEILNAVRKRNEMFARWIDLCSSIAFLMILVITLVNATHLEEMIFKGNNNLSDIISIFTVVVSVSFDFIFSSDCYKYNLYKVNSILKLVQSQEAFENAFVENIDLVKEIDVARARYDKASELQVHNTIDKQKDADKLQPVDIIIMNRQLYIIVVMIIEIILFIGIFIAAKFNPLLIYIIICVMLIAGVVFMILDATENERSKKKIRKIYNVKTEG